MRSVLEQVYDLGHEQVTYFRDARTGLFAIVAVHDTTLGPALGGCRMRRYRSLDAALYDALRLSEAMTYKNSLAGLNLGGGKAVIFADGKMTEGREALLRSFGRSVHSLGGKYVTAEDMGTSVADMGIMLQETPFVSGRDPKTGGGGDPSPYTAIGMFGGIRACLERYFGDGTIQGKHFAIQGVGHVGSRIARLLAEAGAKLTIADTSEDHLRSVCSEVTATAISAHHLLQTECDVLVPCAIGGVINPETVPALRCKIIAGAANNQLEGEGTEAALTARGIMYAPDFAINAGGVILCADELEEGGFTPKRVDERVSRIYHTVGRILDEAKRTGELTGTIAVRLAKERIAEARSKKK